MILALDPSTTLFGFAIGGETDGKPRSWTLKLKGADGGDIDRTLASAAETVGELCRVHQVRLAAIEAPAIISGRSTHTMVALMQLTGAVRAAATRAGATVKVVPVATVRKMFCGNGRADKDAVMARCRLLRWDFADNNAADAAAVWAWAMSVTYPRWAPQATPLFAARQT